MASVWKLGDAERQRHDVSSVKICMHLGAPCPPWLKLAFIEWLGGKVIQEIYGATENLGGTFLMGDEWLEHKGSVGKFMTGCDGIIFDDDGNICRAGVVGTVFMRRTLPDFMHEKPSDDVYEQANGKTDKHKYIGADPLERLNGGWQSVGDMGHMDPDGYLYLADRRSDMILVGGANVFPAEVEAALDSFPEVRSSAVVGLPDEVMGSHVHAIVEGDSVHEAALREHVRERLVVYKLPSSYYFVREPLRDEGGKLCRAKLRQRALDRMDSVSAGRMSELESESDEFDVETGMLMGGRVPRPVEEPGAWDSLSLLRAGSEQSGLLSKRDVVSAHVNFVCIVLVMVGHSRLFKVARLGTGRLDMLQSMDMLQGAALPGFVVLLGATSRLPADWRTLGWWAARCCLILWVTKYAGVAEAIVKWLYTSRTVQLCFRGSSGRTAAEFLRVEWSKGGDLACLPSARPTGHNIDGTGLAAALWFLPAYVAWLGVDFAAHRWGARRVVLPLALLAHFYVGHAWGAAQDPTHFSAFLARALGNSAGLWWLFALGRHLPAGFPHTLPGKGLWRGATHERVRCCWLVSFALLLHRAAAVDSGLEALEAVGGASWLAAETVRAVISVISVFGLCAAVPATRSTFTRAGRGTIIILIFNQLALHLSKTPMTMAMLYCHERFGPLGALSVVFALCALLAMATVELVTAVLVHVQHIVTGARAYARRGRYRSATVGLLPLVCMLVGAILVFMVDRTGEGPSNDGW
jgi:hypothetical protein